MTELANEISGILKDAVIPIVVGIYGSNVVNNKINLYHLSKYDGKTVTDMPPFIKHLSKEDMQEGKKNIEKAKIELLSSSVLKLEENISPKNLQIFYNNIKTAEFKKNVLMIVLGLGGTYWGKTNKLTYTLDSSFPHELIHLSSTIYDKENNTILSGFRQTKGGADIGVGINEGYTELLTSRYYNKKVKSYHFQVKFAKLFEFFFDNSKELEDLYFGANLPGLICHLEKYTAKDRVIQLLLDMDKIYNYYHEFSSLPTATSTKIQLELYQWFISKNTDSDKLKAFTDLLFQDKLVKVIINSRKYQSYSEQLLEKDNSTSKN